MGRYGRYGARACVVSAEASVQLNTVRLKAMQLQTVELITAARSRDTQSWTPHLGLVIWGDVGRFGDVLRISALGPCKGPREHADLLRVEATHQKGRACGRDAVEERRLRLRRRCKRPRQVGEMPRLTPRLSARVSGCSRDGIEESARRRRVRAHGLGGAVRYVGEDVWATAAVRLQLGLGGRRQPRQAVAHLAGGGLPFEVAPELVP
mmetsp:Transcript_3622/g.11502  ORF Transcript_3622/g.11502 Transcript_3622/m.11502 type:complete len:208 (-) Transcript_3622:212-835(-)